MANIITPIHQFEVRYSNIFDFPNVIGEAIAPYIQLASKINIDHEYSHKQQIALNFDQDYFTITITWDRLIIQVNGFREGLDENNSIIDTPFFELLTKIRNLKSFGEIKNFLYYTLNVQILDKDLESIKSEFNNKYLCDNTRELLPSLEDVGIVLEHHKDNYQIHLNIGPYLGQEDLRKRNLPIKNPRIANEIEKLGLMVEFKYYEENKATSFARYKELAKIEKQYLNKLWEKK